MKFKDFVQKNKLKNKGTSNLKIQQMSSSMSLIDVGIYSRDGSFTSDVGFVSILQSEGTHWVC